MSLREQIEQEICNHGPMPFSRYMEVCLNDPVRGFYSRNAEQFGKAGDFYTSSDVHAVFGRLLARKFREFWGRLGSPSAIDILELGPGRGLFARDVLDWSQKKFPEFFSAMRYSLCESSPALRQKIGDVLTDHMSMGKAVLSSSPSRDDQSRNSGSGDPVIVFANEFFDALPVEILSSQGKLHLALEADGLREVWLAPAARELEWLDRFGVHPAPGERIEVPVIGQGWMSAIAGKIARGFLIAIDYGYTRAEQLAGHHRGTLMTYRQHSASPNPYQAPGEQDITAHVNFTALAAAATEAGMQVAPLCTQSQFLMSIGEENQFADAFEGCILSQERAKVALQLKHLVTPAGMGENFQVLIASRGIPCHGSEWSRR